MASTKDHYQSITDKICAQLELGNVPWKKTWHGDADCPTSISSGKPYKGVNRIVLMCNFQYSSPYYLTYAEAQRRGGYVKKDEKGHKIYFWKSIIVEDEKTGDEKSIPFIKIDHVYNLEQTEGVKFDPPKANQITFTPIEHAQSMISDWSDCPPINHQGDRASYSPSSDRITFPKPENFDSSDFYYQVLFHEMSHSTGHSKRLNRFNNDKCLGHYGSDDYSREELVAELGSAFLCSECKMDNSAVDKNSVAYIQSWLKAFKGDPSMMMWAASRAQKSTDYILSRTDK